MTTLRVLSWNTALSPSMYNRVVREENILKRMHTFKEKADVLVFQEVGSFIIGPISHVAYQKGLSLVKNSPLLTMFLDYFSIGEGILVPHAIINSNVALIKKAKSEGFKYSYCSSKPERYIGNGLLILSKFPILKKLEMKAEGDVIHRPSTLLAEISIKGKKIWIANSYLVPSLNWIKPSYFICNVLNLLFFINPPQLREKHIFKLHKLMNHNLAISMGDFNIRRDLEEYQKIKNLLNLLDSDKKKEYTFKNFFIAEQIDYIFHSKRIKLTHFESERFCEESDHRPIVAEFKIN